jgi:hypothetical protein
MLTYDSFVFFPGPRKDKARARMKPTRVRASPELKLQSFDYWAESPKTEYSTHSNIQWPQGVIYKTMISCTQTLFAASIPYLLYS